jgi:hypothetical protein
MQFISDVDCRQSRKLRLTTVGDPPRMWHPSIRKIVTKFRQEVEVAQSV